MKTVKYREFDRLGRLQRRADYLKIVVLTKKWGPNSADYARGELSAIAWAIPILEAYLVKKYTSKLDDETLAAVEHQIPPHLYQQLLEARK